MHEWTRKKYKRIGDFSSRKLVCIMPSIYRRSLGELIHVALEIHYTFNICVIWALRDTVSTNTTSTLFRILHSLGTGGRQNFPLSVVPELRLSTTKTVLMTVLQYREKNRDSRQRLVYANRAAEHT